MAARDGSGPARWRVLITGGTGGLGLRVAQWLSANGAGRLVLLARRDTPNLDQHLAAIRAGGATVTVVHGDVSRESDLVRVFADLAASDTPLRGVIHAAGTLDDGVVVEQSAEKIERVMASKVAGSWLLHRLTIGVELDFFVLFSSTASLLGSAGQANHAAANAYMDALAHYRRGCGLPALSINWGAWGEVGAAASDSVREFMQTRGVLPMDPSQCIAALEHHLVDQGRAQVGVAAIDWSTLFARRQASPFLSEQSAPAVKGRSQDADIAGAVRAASGEEQLALLCAFLRAEVAKVLAIAHLDRIGVDRGFFELGMDSLTAVEFRNNLQRKLDCRLPETVAFDCPTIDTLAQHLSAIMSPASPITGELDRIQQLTTAEAVAELERELGALD